MKLNAATRDIPLPPRMSKLPIDKRGYIVPAFVAMVDGEWDFRAIKPGYTFDCYKHNKCWLCGEPLGKYKCYAVGPMCAINLVSSEPPSHYQCVEYAVKACPFLTKPRMVRNDKDMPDGTSMPGIGLSRNPGVTAIWVTNHPLRTMATPTGPLFRLPPDPVRIEWWAEGRQATNAEVLASIHSGMPFLRRECRDAQEVSELAAHVRAASRRIGMEINADENPG